MTPVFFATESGLCRGHLYRPPTLWSGAVWLSGQCPDTLRQGRLVRVCFVGPDGTEMTAAARVYLAVSGGGYFAARVEGWVVDDTRSPAVVRGDWLH